MENNITDALKKGTVLQNGLYTIRQVLGQGATGITYLADMRHNVEGNLGGFSTNVQVAIKEFYMKCECQRGVTTLNVVIPNTKNSAQVEQYKESFIKEARKISGLSHPNIVHVLGVFEENDTVYYAMQYIRGGSIKDLMEKEGALPENKALNFAYQVASAMDYMHVKKHMCHYDLKPGNIMIDANGEAQLIDFGIAKNYDEQGNETSTTPPGLTKGFAPLEQYSSIDGFSPKSDVYSLGATLYSMLTNTTPPEPMAWVNGNFTPCPQGVSKQTWDIVRQAMQLSTAERPDMKTLKNEISVALGRPVENPVGDVYVKPIGNDETVYRDMSNAGGAMDVNAGTVRENDNAAQTASSTLKDHADSDKKKDTIPLWRRYIIYVIVAVIIGGVGFFIGKVYLADTIHDLISPDTKENLQVETVEGEEIYDSNGQITMIYSGEMENGKRQGKGVLVYKTSKEWERYEGRFLNGLREDSAAVLFFRNGDVYRGSFIDDHLATGTYFVNKSGEYFRGIFKNDKPWEGYWYDNQNNIIRKVSH